MAMEAEQKQCRVDGLAESLRRGEEGVIRQAVEADAGVATEKDGSDRFLLHWTAVSTASAAVLEAVYRANPAALHSEDDSGITPVSMAAAAGRLPTLRLLLAWGAKPDEPNHRGLTPLHYAASKAHLDCARQLLAAGASPDVQDRLGASPLHRAASQGHRSLVALLLQQPGIHLDLADVTGATPLHLAAEEDREDVAADLVKRGASVTRLNKDKKTPLDLASPSLRRTLNHLDASYHNALNRLNED